MIMSKIWSVFVLLFATQLRASEISIVTSFSDQISQSKNYDDFTRIEDEIQLFKKNEDKDVQALEEQMRILDQSIGLCKDRLDRLKSGIEFDKMLESYVSCPEKYCYSQDSKISESMKINLFEVLKARRALENEKYNQIAIQYWQSKLEQSQANIQEELSASFATKKYAIIAQLQYLNKSSKDLALSHANKQKLMDNLSELTEQLSAHKSHHKKTLDSFAMLVRRAIADNTYTRLREEKMLFDAEKLQELQKKLDYDRQIRLQEEIREQKEAAAQEQLRLKHERAELQRQKAKQAQEKLKREQELARKQQEDEERFLEKLQLQAQEEADQQRSVVQESSTQPVSSAASRVIKSLQVTSVEFQPDVTNYSLSESQSHQLQNLVKQRRKYYDKIKGNDRYLSQFMQGFDAENNFFCQEHLGSIQVMYVLDDLLKQSDLPSYYKLLHDATNKTHRAAQELFVKGSHINKYFLEKDGLVDKIKKKLQECEEVCNDAPCVQELKNEGVRLKCQGDALSQEIDRLEHLSDKKDKKLKKQISDLKLARDKAAQRFDRCAMLLRQLAIRDDLRVLVRTMVPDLYSVCRLTRQELEEFEKHIHSFVINLLEQNGCVLKSDIERLLLDYLEGSDYDVADIDDTVKNFSQHVIYAVVTQKAINVQDLFVVMMTGADCIPDEYQSCFADLSQIIVSIIKTLQDSGVGIEELSNEEQAQRSLSKAQG